MKKLTKWLLILSVICVSGGVASAALAGHIYYKGSTTYTDYQKQELNAAALKEISINSAVPIHVQKTDGKPYVEFNQNFIDLIGQKPQYELKVEERDGKSYISIDQLTNINLWFGIKKNEIQATLYLPETTIERLTIGEAENGYSGKDDTSDINLQNVNVKQLDLNIDSGDIKLKGSFDQVKIIAGWSNVQIESETPSDVEINSGGMVTLNGAYEKINITDASDINISSDTLAEVKVDSSSAGINIEGKYSKITTSGNSSVVDIKSDAPCDTSVAGEAATVYLKGAYKSIETYTSAGSVNIEAAVVPAKISCAGSEMSLNMILPSNVPGISLTYNVVDYKNEGENEDHANIEESIMNNYITSDFKLINGDSQGNKSDYYYGNGALPIIIQGEEMVNLTIKDGGYTSEN